jgi:hypothetical protein
LKAELHRNMPLKAKNETEKQRLARLESAFKTKYPSLEIDKSVLKLVRSEPYNPPSKDKEVNRRITTKPYS